MTLENDAIALHRILKGKIAIQSRITANFDKWPSITGAESKGVQGNNETDKEAKKVNNFGVLELIYTPGVAAVAEAITSPRNAPGQPTVTGTTRAG